MEYCKCGVCVCHNKAGDDELCKRCNDGFHNKNLRPKDTSPTLSNNQKVVYCGRCGTKTKNIKVINKNGEKVLCFFCPYCGIFMGEVVIDKPKKGQKKPA